MATNQYRPDYAVPPGWVLAERLSAQGISRAEFARRCDRSAKLISEIVAGKAPIEPKTALQFEKVLGVDAGIWLGIEADYRLHQMREAEAREAEESAAWSRTFPIVELAKRGAIRRSSSRSGAVSELLAFFGVASIKAWQAKYGTANVAYRHSPSFGERRAFPGGLASSCSDRSQRTGMRYLRTDGVQEGIRAYAPFDSCRGASGTRRKRGNYATTRVFFCHWSNHCRRCA